MSLKRRTFLGGVGALTATALSSGALAQSVVDEILNTPRRGAWGDRYDTGASGGLIALLRRLALVARGLRCGRRLHLAEPRVAVRVRLARGEARAPAAGVHHAHRDGRLRGRDRSTVLCSAEARRAL